MTINFPNNNVKNGDIYSPPEAPNTVYVYNAARGMWIGGSSSFVGQPSPNVDVAGFTGSRGYMGSRGYTGSQSTTPGLVGSRGYTGSRGNVGSSGRTSIPVSKGGEVVVPSAATLNFIGTGVTVANGANGIAQITINNSSSGNGTRTTVTGSTGYLGTAASVTKELTTAKGYALYSMTTSKGAWVTMYSSAASRTSDANRIKTTDPLPNSGVIAEVITTGSDPSTVLFTPAVFGFNSESPVAGKTYLKIVNNTGVELNDGITVSISHLGLES